MKAPNASAARVDGIAATSQRDQKRARPRRQGGGKPRPGKTRMGAPAPAARGPKVALCGPENAREGGPPWPGWWATPPAGDLNHDLVQVDESAIAGNVGRDLAFAASRLAARSHPGVGGCAAPSSLVIFGISQPNARWTAGCSCTAAALRDSDAAYTRAPGTNARTFAAETMAVGRRHRALQCAADARRRVAKRTVSWLARARLGLDCHEFSSASSRACTRVRLMGTAAAHALCAPHSRPPATHRRRPRVGRPGFPLSS